MAKKTKARKKSSSKQPQRQPQGWRQRMILGGVVLVLVIGIGVFIRYRQQRMIPPRLQGAIDNHYTRGTAGAPVIIKEFSDFT